MARKKNKKPKVNPELQGFEIEVNNFGEITSSFQIDRLNKFLDREVEDKKLMERDDYKEIKSSK